MSATMAYRRDSAAQYIPGLGTETFTTCVATLTCMRSHYVRDTTV